MKKREQSVNALLNRAESDLQKVKKEYEKALTAQTIPDDLRIDIKNLCGNLRSVLDYLAQDIRETHCQNANPNARFYFPIISTSSAFAGQMANWYPSLDLTCKEIWDYLESVQPFQAGFEWLGQFNHINNENKHDDLVAQTRTEDKQTRVDFSGRSVSWNPDAVRFGPGVSIGGVPVDPRTQMPIPHPSQKVTQTVWVDFRFAGINVSAIGLLHDSLTGIKKLAEDIYAWL